MTRKKNKKKFNEGNAVTTVTTKDPSEAEGVKDESSSVKVAEDTAAATTATTTAAVVVENKEYSYDDADINEPMSFVGDIDVSDPSGASSRDDAIDTQDRGTGLTGGEEQTIKDAGIDKNSYNNDTPGRTNPQRPQKVENDMIDFSSTQSIKVGEADTSPIPKPLLSKDIAQRQDRTDKIASYPNKEPVEREVSYEETSALISKIEEGVKETKPSQLKSDDPWSSFDLRDCKKSKSVVVIEEYSAGIWNWVIDRTCCKRRNRAAEL